MKETLQLHLDGMIHSYSQIFFSKNKVFGILVLLGSFVNWELGVYGVIGAIITNVLAHIIKFDRLSIQEGLYGVNSSLVCMAIAAMYSTNEQLIFFIFSACLLSLFINVALNGFFSRFGLPSLSTPFILTVWILILASRQYDSFEISEGNTFYLNELYSVGGNTLVSTYQYFENIEFPLIIDVFLRSLGAILFQYNALTGLLIAVGLLASSRIAFTLSIIGFTTGYFYYTWFEGDLTHLHYSYIGFNFILYSIAIGGFFYIANWRVFLFVILIAPIVAILIGASNPILSIWQLPVFSIPFVIVVQLVLYISNFTYSSFLKKVLVPLDSPESNLYNDHNNQLRFGGANYFKIQLPFYGEWKIAQGYNGDLTHKGDWNSALDFVVIDQDNKTFKLPGSQLDDFHSYNLPVLAPANGYVVAIENEVEDNEVGEVNTEKNWGNSIVIKHTEGLYTQISHLRKDTFKVNINDYVKKGDILAKLGNSGRSPEPHIHFQVQSTPFIGSKTLEYPLSAYILKTDDGIDFKSFQIPNEEDVISNINIHKLLKNAFDFTPGKKFRVESDIMGEKVINEWEVFTDAFNVSYFYCHNTESIAYFENDGNMHYFTSYKGDNKTALYYFYVACYKVLLGFYQNFNVTDNLPLQEMVPVWKRFAYDFISPFKILLKSNYNINYNLLKESLSSGEIQLLSKIEGSGLNHQFKIQINEKGFESITIDEQSKIKFL